MDKLNLYVIRDEVAQDNTFVVTAKNDEEAYRNAKMALCAVQPNFVNTHTKDKRIVYIGYIDVDTAIVHPEASPVPLRTIEDIRLELLHEIAIAKKDALDELLKAGINEKNIDQARALVKSFDDVSINGPTKGENNGNN